PFSATALSTSTITAHGVAASANVSVGSGSLTLGGAGTGAVVLNDIDNTIEAGAVGGSDVSSGGAATIHATDSSHISSDVVAASASVTAGSNSSIDISFAISYADNTIDNHTSALVDASTLDAGGALDLRAHGSGSVHVTGVSAALSVSASSGSLAVSGAGTVA